LKALKHDDGLDRTEFKQTSLLRSCMIQNFSKVAL